MENKLRTNKIQNKLNKKNHILALTFNFEILTRAFAIVKGEMPVFVVNCLVIGLNPPPKMVALPISLTLTFILLPFTALFSLARAVFSDFNNTMFNGLDFNLFKCLYTVRGIGE